MKDDKNLELTQPLMGEQDMTRAGVSAPAPQVAGNRSGFFTCMGATGGAAIAAGCGYGVFGAPGLAVGIVGLVAGGIEGSKHEEPQATAPAVVRV